MDLLKLIYLIPFIRLGGRGGKELARQNKVRFFLVLPFS